jgi:hypothetical protein
MVVSIFYLMQTISLAIKNEWAIASMLFVVFISSVMLSFMYRNRYRLKKRQRELKNPPVIQLSDIPMSIRYDIISREDMKKRSAAANDDK